MEVFRPRSDFEEQRFYDLVYGAVTGVLIDRGPAGKTILGVTRMARIGYRAVSDAILDYEKATQR